jgi:hypothetical protein
MATTRRSIDAVPLKTIPDHPKTYLNQTTFNRNIFCAPAASIIPMFADATVFFFESQIKGW